MDPGVKEGLLDICRRHVVLSAEDETVPEPYIPYVPDDWNRGLVLAEAQNHGTKSREYLAWLRGEDATARMLRLHAREGQVGCQPWDDGSLKLAVASVFDSDPDQWAVANAVLWSRVDSAGRNERPSDRMTQNSARLWDEFLNVLRPEWVVTAGKVARTVIDQTQYQGHRLSLQLPSPSNLSRVSGLFDESDLLERYPEVAATVTDHPEFLHSGYRRNKILFACHAVSTARKP